MLFLPKRRRAALAIGARAAGAGATAPLVLKRSLRAAGTPAPPRTRACAITIGTPSLTARGISRSLGTRISGSRPRTRDDVVVA